MSFLLNNLNNQLNIYYLIICTKIIISIVEKLQLKVDFIALSFFEKKTENLKYSDIYNLVCINKIPESYNLDYKINYPKNEKLAKLMCSFANASGGYIIVGIEELSVGNQNTGEPEKIHGVEKADHTTKVTNIAISHSQPKIVPDVKTIEIDTIPDKVVVIIKIDESLEPIMYYSKNDSDSNKYFIRINDKNEPMDQPTLKKLFLAKPYIETMQKLKEDYQTYQDQLYDIYGSELDQARILLGMQILPFNKNIKIFDFNTTQFEEFLNLLHNSFNIVSPGGKVHNFKKYLRNFLYLGDKYISRYQFPQVSYQQKSELSISNIGIIRHSISFLTKNGNTFLEDPKYEHNSDAEHEIKWATHLYFRTLPYLFVNWLKLANLVLGASFRGKLNISIRILAYNGLTIPIENYLYLSSTDDIIIERSFYASDLEENKKVIKIVLDLLKEVLRYLGFNIESAEKKILKFKDDINKYLS